MFSLSPLCPAYGRDYKSKKALELDFNADMDFVAANGSYTNKTDLLRMRETSIQVRYGKLRKTTVIDIKGDIIPIVEEESKYQKFKGLTCSQYEKLENGLQCVGYCINCSRKVIGVEDDAENYTCPRCKKNTVQGLGNLLMMGYVN